MSNEINIGDWTITEAGINRLTICYRNGNWSRGRLKDEAKRCCEILGIDPNADSVARDIAEEIVLHGTPVYEVIERLKRHLEGSQ